MLIQYKTLELLKQHYLWPAKRAMVPLWSSYLPGTMLTSTLKIGNMYRHYVHCVCKMKYVCIAKRLLSRDDIDINALGFPEWSTLLAIASQHQEPR